ncbi:CHAT domain-containing protein [Nocardioides sp. T2.26MG-1]|uniref:CHAT domain-containing protein n=1 Tax=Nocardioides sp. T2.26MG-1 TaxID=3041166 RepID=UPI002477BC3A|nr:CHAT domain-containing protein [Nocardioides sp. T2.26MG-1]CAI9402838.1 hypothetical protein HIDPHFAB_00899 [Nocardioides sp. T2.26MG-1]
MPTAPELHRRAVEALNARQFGVAGRLLARASRATSDFDLLARIEASLAFLEYETGNPAVGIERCERALASELITADTRGVVQCQRALLLLRQGQAARALTAFDEAIGSLADHQELGIAHVNRGGVYLAQGQPDRACHDFRSARDHWHRLGRTHDVAIATHNLGYACFLLGDLVGALHHMRESGPVLEASSPVMAATVNQDRAEVLMATGQVEEGMAALRAAAAAYGSRRMHQRQGEAELALALTVLETDTTESGAAARRAMRCFGKAGAEAWSVRAEAAWISAEIERGRRRGALLARGEELASELEAQGLRWRAAGLRRELARAELRSGGPELARARLQQPVAARAPLALRLLDRDVRAELAAVEGRRAHALHHLRAGLADLHTWQSSFGSLDLQTGVAGHGVRLGTRGLALAVESRKPAVLFEWSERARMLASRVQPVRAPEDEQIVADLTELREMAAEGGRRDPEREVELRQRIRERAWQHRGSGAVADPVTLPELQAALDAATALVAYVVAGDQVVALVVTTDAATWVDLGERTQIDGLLGGLLPDLDVAAAELPGAMAGFVRTELASRLASLAEALVEPVLKAVGERSVVLTPSGVLAGVPWTLLPGFVGRPVTVAQSATSWLARRTTPLRLGSAGFVAGPRVARAEDEVVAAAKEWPDATVLVGDRANAAAVSELAASVDVLHVAAHGRHAAENAMFSGLQLADGPWFGYDIDQLRQVPDVVVLSACEVGRSTVRWGDELIGMATAWLHAGARCVVASAAAVNDRAAYDVLVAVHQQLAAGVEPAAALAAAVPAVTAVTAPVPLVRFG